MSEARILFVLLPGAYMTAADFAANGFIEAIRRRNWPVDVMTVDTGFDGYLDDEIAGRIHDEIAPRRPARLWLGGISLGGMGALLYAQRTQVEKLFLLAPFIGSRGLMTEIAEAGGLRAWHPGDLPEHRLPAWLKTYRADDATWPELRLGYGEDDRFGLAHRLLADLLPADRVFTAKGGHDWQTWRTLWARMLDPT